MEGPTWLLQTSLPKQPHILSIPPAASLWKRSALGDDIAEVDVPSVKRVKNDRGRVVGCLGKTKRLVEEGLVLLESATNGMEDVDEIEIECGCGLFCRFFFGFTGSSQRDATVWVSDALELRVWRCRQLGHYPRFQSDASQSRRSRGVRVETSRKLRIGAFPNHRVASSLVSHGVRKYVSVCVDLQSSKMTYLPVKQLHSRADSLSAKFRQGEGTRYIDEAIDLDRQALELCPPGQSERSISLMQLALLLSTRYKQHGALQDVDEAIILVREALTLRPQGHPDRSMPLNDLAIHLSTRCNQLGAVQDLDEAIILSRDALGLRPQGHPHRSMSLNNLAADLCTRYNQFGTVQDLDEAIILDREALALLQGHPDRSMSLNNLAVHLLTRHNQLGTVQDLDEGIILVREALSLRPQGHPDRSMSLNNLAAHLSTRYNQLGTVQDLDEAILLNREALTLLPQGHPDRSLSLNNLTVYPFTRHNQLGTVQDLDEAILLDREALALRPQGHPHRSMLLTCLASCLRSRFTRSKQLQDQEELFSLYAHLAHITQTVSSTDLSAARSWIHAAEDFNHPTLLLAYETAL